MAAPSATSKSRSSRRNAHASRGTIVFGAHYDSYGDAPGANDNGTGTAAVLELARLLSDLRSRSEARIRLVLFVNEEPPYFQTADMGSYRYARLLAERGEPVIGMISLETLGCFSDQPGSADPIRRRSACSIRARAISSPSWRCRAHAT